VDVAVADERLAVAIGPPPARRLKFSDAVNMALYSTASKSAA
jgi:hypothetical protein